MLPKENANMFVVEEVLSKSFMYELDFLDFFFYIYIYIKKRIVSLTQYIPQQKQNIYLLQLSVRSWTGLSQLLLTFTVGCLFSIYLAAALKCLKWLRAAQQSVPEG